MTEAPCWWHLTHFGSLTQLMQECEVWLMVSSLVSSCASLLDSPVLSSSATLDVYSCLGHWILAHDNSEVPTSLLLILNFQDSLLCFT